MSKIIKPSNKKIFQSAQKFEKEPLLFEPESGKIVRTPDASASPEKGSLDPKSRPRHMHTGQFADEGRLKEKTTVQDTEIMTQQVIREAETKARQIIEEAEKQAGAVRQEAREQARSEGFEEAVKRGEKDLQAVSDTLKSLVAGMEKREAEIIQLLTPMLANLSIEVAQKIIQKEIAEDSAIVKSQAERAISKILEREKILIRVHPSDEALLKKYKAELKEMFDGIDKIEVIGDSSVERGGCVVETDLVRVDAQPKSQLEAARMALLGETEE